MYFSFEIIAIYVMPTLPLLFLRIKSLNKACLNNEYTTFYYLTNPSIAIDAVKRNSPYCNAAIESIYSVNIFIRYNLRLGG